MVSDWVFFWPLMTVVCYDGSIFSFFLTKVTVRDDVGKVVDSVVED